MRCQKLLISCLFLMSFSISFTRCSSQKEKSLNPVTSQSSGQMVFKMPINKAATNGVEVDSIFVAITGPSNLQGTLAIISDSAFGNFAGLLPGSYQVIIKAYGQNGVEVASGLAQAEVKPGQTTKVSITMIIKLGALQISASWVYEETTNNDLIAFYPFNGNANDSSNNHHNGVVSGATLIQDRFGNENGAYYFDGIDDEIRISNPFDSCISNKTPISIVVWVKTKSTKDASGIVTQHSACLGTNDHNYFIVLYGTDYNYGPSLQATFFSAPRLNTSSLCILDNQWHQIAAVYDGTTSKMYIDGSLKDSLSVSPESAFEADKDLVIGAFNSSSCYWTNCRFEGAIDDVKIFKRALSIDDIIGQL